MVFHRRFMKFFKKSCFGCLAGGAFQVWTRKVASLDVGIFRKLGVPYFGVLIIRILLFRVLY